jgi:hypothetical protein
VKGNNVKDNNVKAWPYSDGNRGNSCYGSWAPGGPCGGPGGAPKGPQKSPRSGPGRGPGEKRKLRLVSKTKKVNKEVKIKERGSRGSGVAG